MNLEEAIRSWTSRAGIIRVRNVLNPILWTTTVVLPTTLVGAYFFKDDPFPKYGLSILGVSTVIATFVGYFYFLFRDPDRLQSEEFVLKQQELWIASRNIEGAAQPIEAEGRELPNVVEVEPREGEPS